MNLVHFIELILVLAILIAVGLPLFRETPQNKWFSAPDEWQEELSHLLVRKEETLLSIKELEFDYKTDKLSKEDYEDLRRKLETTAFTILERIDQLEKTNKDTRKSSKRADVA
ncbi:MAG: hypothetical protein A3K09_06710 [Nitrospinae bacterium RIFCSPLOWO2_12_FULL_47_7]|nr:MAG: hypothetical protein A3K09_06710 [Nitrospinae bacterium RIFCSPLOWO2_12_FULL_47_7]